MLRRRDFLAGAAALATSEAHAQAGRRVLGLGVFGGARGPSGVLQRFLPAFDTTVANTETTERTDIVKIEAEAAFTGVRLWWWNSLNIPLSGISAIVAPTETALNDTNANTQSPIVGGSVNNSAWKTVTWNKVPTGTVPAGRGASVGAPLLLRPTGLRSDYIPVSSIPRADGGDRPLLLFRAHHNGLHNVAFAGRSGTMDPNQGRDKAYSRGTQGWSPTGINGVSDPTLFQDLAGVQTLGGMGVLWIGIEFIYSAGVKGRSVFFVGDSITAHYVTWRYSVDAFFNRSMMAASDGVEPVHCVNGGLNGRVSLEFLPQIAEMISDGYVPTDVVIPVFSPNDSIDCGTQTTDAIFPILQMCQGKGIQAWVWTPMPRGDLDAANDAKRLAHVPVLDGWVSQGLCKKLDLDSIVSTGTPERYITTDPLGTFDSGDGLHPSWSGGEKMRGYIAPFFQSTHAPRVRRKTSIVGNFRSGGTIYGIPADVSAKPAVSGRTYQWLRDGVAIGGATSATYAIQAGDLTHALSLQETITNSSGNVISASLAITVLSTTETILLTSADISTGTTITGLTSSLNQFVDPISGATTVDRITETATTDTHDIALTGASASTAGTTCCFRAIVRAPTGNNITATLSLANNIISGSQPRVLFDLCNGRIWAKNNLSGKIFPLFPISGTDDGTANYWFIEVSGNSISNVNADPRLSTSNNRFTYRNTFLGNVNNVIDIALMEYARGASAWHCTLAPGEVTQ